MTETFFNEIENLDLIYKGKIKTRNEILLKLLDYLNNDKIELYPLAVEAKRITQSFFGKTVLIYAPLYISNYCINGCLYCGFSKTKKIKRKKLSYDQIKNELLSLKNKGFDTVLLLTGEDRVNSPFEYIKKSVEIASELFSEVMIEVYPLSETEYSSLVKAGLSGMTLYQETYDRKLYSELHPLGPKKDYRWRLEAVERALKSGIKEVSIGALMGLHPDWKYDVFMSIAHAEFLQKRYPDAEINISFPRIRESVAENKCFVVSDRNFVKSIIISRILLPRAGINLSTRESSFIRDNIIEAGVTRISAESKTTVGGYSKKESGSIQFEVSDTRTVQEIVKMLREKGYRAEFTNWVRKLKI